MSPCSSGYEAGRTETPNFRSPDQSSFYHVPSSLSLFYCNNPNLFIGEVFQAVIILNALPQISSSSAVFFWRWGDQPCMQYLDKAAPFICIKAF